MIINLYIWIILFIIWIINRIESWSYVLSLDCNEQTLHTFFIRTTRLKFCQKLRTLEQSRLGFGIKCKVYFFCTQLYSNIFLKLDCSERWNTSLFYRNNFTRQLGSNLPAKTTNCSWSQIFHSRVFYFQIFILRCFIITFFIFRFFHSQIFILKPIEARRQIQM